MKNIKAKNPVTLEPANRKHGFAYDIVQLFNRSNLGRVALPRQYNPPKTNIAGSSGIFVQRSMEVYKPAIAYQGRTLIPVTPSGLAGNSPLSSATTFSPLVNTFGLTGQFSQTGSIGT